MSDKVLGWLWLPASTKVEVGQMLTVEGPLSLRGNSLYAYLRALDALLRASGPVIRRVELSGKIAEANNRLYAQHCKVLAMADATTVLHEFMYWNAKEALLRGREEAGREPDKRSWAALEVKRKWLKGEATDEELEAAGDAVWSAAWTATVARSAVWTAAWAAAGTVVGEAVWSAAWRSARAATRYVAKDAQNAKLEEMLNALLEEAKKNA